MPSTSLLQKLLIAFYKLLYDQFAWSYSLVAWLVSVGQWNQWVEKVIPFLGHGKILELGHGPGHLQSAAFDMQSDICGIDLSRQMGKICWSRLVRQEHQPRLVTARGENIPFLSGNFSTIVATFPSDYIIKKDTLSEIFRTLEPSGKFILLPAAWITGRSIFYRSAALLAQISGQSLSPIDARMINWLEIFRRAGFEIEQHRISLDHSEVLILVGVKNNQTEDIW